MSATVTNEYGKVTYADSVIAFIAGQSAAECYGLVGMSQRNLGEGISSIFKSDGGASKGVEVETDGSDVVSIKLYVTVKYGVSLAAVAENVIDKVKYNVENDTGVKVKSVDIVVQGIQL